MDDFWLDCLMQICQSEKPLEIGILSAMEKREPNDPMMKVIYIYIYSRLGSTKENFDSCFPSEISMLT